MKSIRLVVVLDYCKVYIYKTTEICHLAAKTFKKQKTNNKSIKSITLGKVHNHRKVHTYKTTETCHLAVKTLENKNQ
jgi:hypothetical protein